MRAVYCHAKTFRASIVGVQFNVIPKTFNTCRLISHQGRSQEDTNSIEDNLIGVAGDAIRYKMDVGESAKDDYEHRRRSKCDFHEKVASDCAEKICVAFAVDVIAEQNKSSVTVV